MRVNYSQASDPFSRRLNPFPTVICALLARFSVRGDATIDPPQASPVLKDGATAGKTRRVMDHFRRL